MRHGTHTVPGMTRTEKTVNLVAVVLPFAATLAAVVLLWNRVVHPADLGDPRRACTCSPRWGSPSASTAC